MEGKSFCSLSLVLINIKWTNTLAHVFLLGDLLPSFHEELGLGLARSGGRVENPRAGTQDPFRLQWAAAVRNVILRTIGID